ncbi:MAG: T9SS type A sorting domain-containing protein [Saprospiraceae bacterium]
MKNSNFFPKSSSAIYARNVLPPSNYKYSKNDFYGSHEVNSNLKNAYKSIVLILSLLLISFIQDKLLSQTITSSCSTCGGNYQTIGTTNGTTDYRTLTGFSSARCYFVKGTLVITGSPVVWANLKLKMEEKAQIIVQSTLSMNNCYLSGCTDLWQGISTSGGGYLFVYGSVIEDANIGISLADLAGFVCLHTKFINNYIGIASGSPFLSDQFDHQIQRCQIWGCQFYTETTLPDPYVGHPYYPSWPTTYPEIPYNQGYAAVFLSGTGGINIGYKGADSGDRNKVHDMRNGIVMRNSVGDIYGTDFYNFKGKIPASVANPILDLNQHAIDMYRCATLIKENTMDSLMVGIYARESNNTIDENEIEISRPTPGSGFTRGIQEFGPQKLSITNNQVNEGFRGISIEDVTTDFLVKDNDLDRNFYFGGINMGIFVRNAKLDPGTGIIEGNTIDMADATVANGIHLATVNRITVDGNTLLHAGGGGHQSRGIICSGTYNSYIAKNTSNATMDYRTVGNRGIEFFNSAFDIESCNQAENYYMNFDFEGPCSNIQFVANTINDGTYGLALTTPCMLGTQKHNGNIWDGTFDINAAYIFGSSEVQTALFSQFIVDQSENSLFMPSSIGPPTVDLGNWFINESTPGYTLTCPIVTPSPIADPDTLQKLIRTELAFDDYNDEMTWNLKADIFHVMISDPSLHSNTVLDSFYDAEDGNALGKLIFWEDELMSRFGVQKTDKNLTQDTINYLSADIVYIDSILALSPSDSATWLALRDMKADSLLDEYAEWLDFLNDEFDASQDEYADILLSLKFLTTTNDLEANLKDALLFKIQYLTGVSFDDVDSAAIVDLTDLCPWEGGRAIPEAESIYATINNNMSMPSLDNCTFSPYLLFPHFVSPYEGEDFSVFPNPVKDVVEVHSNDVMEELKLTDLNMKSIYNYKPSKKIFIFNVNEIPAGVYLITIKTTTGYSTKQIIVSK